MLAKCFCFLLLCSSFCAWCKPTPAPVTWYRGYPALLTCNYNVFSTPPIKVFWHRVRNKIKSQVATYDLQNTTFVDKTFSKIGGIDDVSEYVFNIKVNSVADSAKGCYTCGVISNTHRVKLLKTVCVSVEPATTLSVTYSGSGSKLLLVCKAVSKQTLDLQWALPVTDIIQYKEIKNEQKLITTTNTATIFTPSKLWKKEVGCIINSGTQKIVIKKKIGQITVYLKPLILGACCMCCMIILSCYLVCSHFARVYNPRQNNV